MRERRSTNSINEAAEHHPLGGRSKGEGVSSCRACDSNDGASPSEGKKGQSGEKDLLGWLVPKDPGVYGAAHVACLLIGVGCN